MTPPTEADWLSKSKIDNHVRGRLHTKAFEPLDYYDRAFLLGIYEFISWTKMPLGAVYLSTTVVDKFMCSLISLCFEELVLSQAVTRLLSTLSLSPLVLFCACELCGCYGIDITMERMYGCWVWR
jgi:hypothetical protein